METQGLWDVILKHVGITVLVEFVSCIRDMTQCLWKLKVYGMLF